MGDITNNIDGLFFLSVGTMVIGFLHFSIRYCYKSKCKEVNLCCLNIKRDVKTEENEDLNVKSSPSTNLSNEEKI